MNKTKSKRPESKRVREMDIVVGRRIREMRLLMNLSQEALAKEVGLTFQQIQKYELAVNRVSAGVLIAIANVFGCPVTWFYGENGNEECNPFTNQELQLIKAYRQAPDRVREAIVDLMKFSKVYPAHQSVIPE